ncbi:very long chain fatty acid elongase AAEL008004-like isoform X1 [Zophobas morio]|uniref:very long chain fatty acid elongase AAEL008004-like isoform X1 n=1 Tax=Zophobas morio TaxID=2755281 RepID=UPI003082D8DA
MNNIQEQYNYYVHDLGDPRVKNWYMLAAPLPTVIIIIIYLFLIYKFLPQLMRHRKPYKLTTLIRFYNLFQIISCTLLVHQLATPLSNPSYVWKCERFAYSRNPLALKRVSLSYYFYLIKVAEMVETVFFMMRKKNNQVSSLHVYHHVTTLITAWISGKYFSGGMVAFCMILNSFVHILMYSYYFLSSLGLHWQKYIAKWKPAITMLQMIQLITLVVHASQVLYFDDCNLPHIFFYFYAMNVTIIFFMFKNFFKENYFQNTLKKVS